MLATSEGGTIMTVAWNIDNRVSMLGTNDGDDCLEQTACLIWTSTEYLLQMFPAQLT